GKTIVSGASSGHVPDRHPMLPPSYLGDTIKLWDVATGTELKAISNYKEVNSVAFSPDGKTIVSGSDKQIKLWDAVTGEEIRTLSGHTGEVKSVAFSPDGRHIISSERWGREAIKLWDVASGREIKTFLGHTSFVESVSFSPDGRQILSGSRDGTIRLWDTTGNEIAQFISFADGEWIVFTPDGYYNASPNGDAHLNVRVENKVYGLNQYRAVFNKPEIVANRLSGVSR
ncbi:MAG: WD40 repeat domain-containing protein, partial [Treponema sp.]|nr:WD40 repeat domain-containing protein [Treponema sp.]